jgi:urease accessory protein
MLRALSHQPGKTGAAGACAGTVTLDYDARWRRRATLRTDGGETVLLDLPEAADLRDGDALALEDGRHLVVRAAPEPLAAVSAETPRALARLAWHLGNRHLPVAIEEARLLIRRDHVIEDMLRGLGATVAPVMAPFNPEGGAYGRGRTHAHSHGGDAHADPNAHLKAEQG